MEWVVDGGAMSHICKDKWLFWNLGPAKNVKYLLSANKNALDIVIIVSLDSSF